MKGRTYDLVQVYIYCFGIWEPNLTNFIQNRLEGLSNRTFVDVGANIGYFSLLVGQCMPRGNVVAIEAFPTIFNQLIENININGYNNIKAVNCAATESSHPVSMYYGGVYNEGATTSIKGKFNSAPIVVEGRPLGDILSDLEIRTTRLVKIDTEGAEYSVLKGMFPILNQFPTDVEIVVEITPSALDEKKMFEIFTSFKDEGFYPYVLQNPYDAEYYLSSKKTYRPTRMEAFPDKQTDIIFSRIDNKYLT
jgi:FkbM family methyltransferase